MLFWAVFHLIAPFILFGLALRHKVDYAFGFSATYAFLLKPLVILPGVKITCFMRGDALYAHGLKKRPRWLIRLDTAIEGMAIHGVRLVGLQASLLDTVLGRHPKVNPEVAAILPNDIQMAAPTRRKAALPLQIGMAGILEPVKNQAWAVDLVAGFSPSDCHLHLFGDGPDRGNLEGLVRSKGLSGQVTFWGWVPSVDIWQNLDVLLMPSLHEGMPNALLEAVAHHIPVLASDIAAHREILSRAHCLPLDKPELWHSVLQSMAANPSAMAAEMAACQYEKTRHLIFDWEARIAALIVPPKNRESSLDPYLEKPFER